MDHEAEKGLGREDTDEGEDQEEGGIFLLLLSFSF
jgi:hypothetical protein